MKTLLILAAIVAAVAIAACGGSYGNNSATAAMPATSGQAVSVKDVGNAGRVLVDSSGQALYASDQEAAGRVMCTDACVSFWTPLTIKGGDPHGSVPTTSMAIAWLDRRAGVWRIAPRAGATGTPRRCRAGAAGEPFTGEKPCTSVKALITFA